MIQIVGFPTPSVLVEVPYQDMVHNVPIRLAKLVSRPGEHIHHAARRVRRRRDVDPREAQRCLIIVVWVNEAGAHAYFALSGNEAFRDGAARYRVGRYDEHSPLIGVLSVGVKDCVVPDDDFICLGFEEVCLGYDANMHLVINQEGVEVFNFALLTKPSDI